MKASEASIAPMEASTASTKAFTASMEAFMEAVEAWKLPTFRGSYFESFHEKLS